MLQLKNITKVYGDASNAVHALNGVDIQFSQPEFVSILGPSGCGKTTLLNIIGGLDKYTSGELLIDGKSTKDFNDSEWDAYRNSTIGFVFQTYNLITHLNVLDNVAIALTLSGVSPEERKERAKKVLASMGLTDQTYKKPNQLSGGQMQRVAIARALINNPRVILADEPTGALDSVTSMQIMDILKEISKTRHVIVVTHNQEISKKYSDRVIQLKDGLVVSDSKPSYELVTKEEKPLITTKTSMSWLMAIKLSFKNLMTKKKRTIMTSIAGSIGIIGVALVLAISSGMSTYVSGMQSDALAGFPITVSQTAMTFDSSMHMGHREEAEKFPKGDTIYSYDSSANTRAHTNLISQDYIDYLNAMDKSLYNAISYSYGLNMPVIVQADNGEYKKVDTNKSASPLPLGPSSYFNEMPDSEDFIKSQYDLLENGGVFPSNANEIALIVDSYNRLDVRALEALGIAVAENYKFSTLLGKTYQVINNNDYYTENNGIFIAGTNYEAMYNNPNNIELTIVGIMRVKESSSSELLSSGIVYTTALTETMLASAANSDIAVAQREFGDTKNVLTGNAFISNSYESVMQQIGASAIPTGIQIYPADFQAKDKIKDYLDLYNAEHLEQEQIIYSDLAETITSMISTLINTITIILSALAAISLVVSTIMIGIITYVSVVERTKEIGILRAIGARKKDISRIFNAETLIIGFIAGLFGITITYLLSIPLNLIISSLVGVSSIVSLPILYALALVVGSMSLTLIGGLIPASGAAKKDPVLALRTE